MRLVRFYKPFVNEHVYINPEHVFTIAAGIPLSAGEMTTCIWMSADSDEYFYVEGNYNKVAQQLEGRYEPR